SAKLVHLIGNGGENCNGNDSIEADAYDAGKVSNGSSNSKSGKGNGGDNCHGNNNNGAGTSNSGKSGIGNGARNGCTSNRGDDSNHNV
ncbi:hypothetical protein K7432_015196, partial [Basidiobolus ranarum]